MDITSFLIGKEVGGGSAPTPTYQDKEITITQNGEQTITADSGYDALSSVEITTNVPQPSGKITITENGTNIDVSSYATADVSVSGGGGSIQDIASLNTKINDDIDNFLDNLNNSVSLRTAITNESVSLYTPNADYTKYIICYYPTNQQYYLYWYNTNSMSWVDLGLNSAWTRDFTLDYRDYVSFKKEDGELVINTTQELKPYNTNESRTYYACQQTFNSLQEALDGMKNNTLTYTSKGGQGMGFQSVACSNSVIGTGNSTTQEFGIASCMIISHNETYIAMS